MALENYLKLTPKQITPNSASFLTYLQRKSIDHASVTLCKSLHKFLEEYLRNAQRKSVEEKDVLLSKDPGSVIQRFFVLLTGEGGW